MRKQSSITIFVFLITVAFSPITVAKVIDTSTGTTSSFIPDLPKLPPKDGNSFIPDLPKLPPKEENSFIPDLPPIKPKF